MFSADITRGALVVHYSRTGNPKIAEVPRAGSEFVPAYLNYGDMNGRVDSRRYVALIPELEHECAHYDFNDRFLVCFQWIK